MNLSPNEPKSSLRPFAIEGLVLLAGTILVPLIAFMDREMFMHGNSEHSLTEKYQLLLVILTATVFWAGAVRLPAHRAWLVTLGGFFTIVLIREMDYYLDFVYHGFWKLPATVMMAATAVLAWRSRNSFMHGLRQFLSHNAYVYVLVGLLLVVVFSRLFGSSNFLEPIMRELYIRAVKTFIQESLESYGYFLICLGALKYGTGFLFRQTPPRD